jgi:hypothetical protein
MNLILIVVLKANLESNSPSLAVSKPSTFTFYVNHNNFILHYIIWLTNLDFMDNNKKHGDKIPCIVIYPNIMKLFLKPHYVWRVDEWECHSEFLAQEHRGPREEAFPYTNLSISMLLNENWNLVWLETRFNSTHSTHKPNIISCVIELMQHQLKFAMWSENTSYLFIYDN